MEPFRGAPAARSCCLTSASRTSPHWPGAAPCCWPAPHRFLAMAVDDLYRPRGRSGERSDHFRRAPELAAPPVDDLGGAGCPATFHRYRRNLPGRARRPAAEKPKNRARPENGGNADPSGDLPPAIPQGVRFPGCRRSRPLFGAPGHQPRLRFRRYREGASRQHPWGTTS